FAARHTVPDVRGAQVPSTAAPAATVQAWQSVVLPPPHAVLQHTPSTQKPLWQSLAPVHAAPFANRVRRRTFTRSAASVESAAVYAKSTRPWVPAASAGRPFGSVEVEIGKPVPSSGASAALQRPAPMSPEPSREA